MTNEDRIKALRQHYEVGVPCTECPYYGVFERNGTCVYHLMIDAADALEAAEAQMPKEGEWIFSRGDGKTCVDGWTCSACGNSFHTNVPYFEEFHYCPNCGASMKKGANDEQTGSNTPS